jgi:hypothetical protein
MGKFLLGVHFRALLAHYEIHLMLGEVASQELGELTKDVIARVIGRALRDVWAGDKHSAWNDTALTTVPVHMNSTRSHERH